MAQHGVLTKELSVSSGANAVAKLLHMLERTLGSGLVATVLLALALAPCGLTADELSALMVFAAEGSTHAVPLRVYMLLSHLHPLVVQCGRHAAWTFSSTATQRLVRDHYRAARPEAEVDIHAYMTELFLRRLKQQGTSQRVGAALPNLLLNLDDDSGMRLDTKGLVSALLSHPSLWLHLVEEQQDDGGRAARRVWIMLTDAARSRLCETALAYITREAKRYLERMRRAPDIDDARMADKQLAQVLARATRLAHFAEVQNDRPLSLHLYELCYQLQVRASERKKESARERGERETGRDEKRGKE